MLFRLLSVLLVLAAPLRAEVPRVVTDILPIHSLVAMVMQGVGSPELLMEPNASPHHYAMRPSEAAALEKADLVIWIGPVLTPWLERPVGTLVENERSMKLIDHAEVLLATEDDHGEEHGDAIDPHLWLDPVNAQRWLPLIAQRLSLLDQSNAELYQKNAQTGVLALAALMDEMRDNLGPLLRRKYAVHHDAYGYFEGRFDLEHSFSILDSHAENPGPSRIAHLHDAAESAGISCVFTDGIEGMGILETVIEGHQTEVITVDPIGSALSPGPLLYMALMRGMSLTMAGC